MEDKKPKAEKSEDIGLVVGSKEFALWTEIKETAEKEIEKTKEYWFKVITVQTALKELAELKLKELG